VVQVSAHAPDSGAIPEFRRYQPRAGHPDWPRLWREAVSIADHLRPQLERPHRARERRRQLAAFATAARNFVRNRRLDRKGREDLRPLYFIWTLLRTCNFTCTYCDDHRGRKYPVLPGRGALSTAEGIRLLEIMRTGTPSVYFAGGEPTLRKDLPELTRKAHELNYYPIIVNTNGSIIEKRLRHSKWRTWLADTDILVVSLDALDLSVLRTMWASSRAEIVIRNLLLLRALADDMGFKLMVNTVIQPGMVSHARDVLDLANDLGIWFCPVPMNVGPRADERLSTDPAYRALAETILERKHGGDLITGSVRMNQRLLLGDDIECRNTLKPHIDYDGRVWWPCKASVNVQPALLDVLEYPDVDALYEAGRKLIDPTGFQGPAADQCGARCSWAQNYSTDAYVHGLRHPAHLLGDVVGFLDRG
jgi:MoaA/NifB/PqqE/SkfB family radical SAM enzyme